MFKATGLQIAIAAALLISVSPPAYSDPAGCADESSGCNRGEERDQTSKIDVRESPKPEKPEKPEGEEPEGEQPEGEDTLE